MGQTPPKIYGPFLNGSLGPATNDLMDVALSPDNKYAFISNYRGQEIYRVDLSDPKNPALAGKLSISGGRPCDIAISPDGNYGVIIWGTSGKLMFFDPYSFAGYSVYTMTTAGALAQSVALAANGTVMLTDFNKAKIYFGRVNDDLNGLVSESSLPTSASPVNVAISPDGTTALVACWYVNIDVFQITGPGTVVPGATPLLNNALPDSIDFSPDGRIAYVYSSNLGPDFLSWYRINSPGNVTAGAVPAASLLTCYTFPPPGVEILAVAPNGLYAITHGNDGCLKKNAQLINLATFSTQIIATNNLGPTGVAAFWGALLAPNNLALARIENSYIFYKEYINSLTWQENAKNTFSVTGYRIYRKPQGSSNSAYDQLAEVSAWTFSYEDRGLGKNDQYTYGVASVDEKGRESQKAVVND